MTSAHSESTSAALGSRPRPDPRLLAVAGAVCMALSAIFVKASEVSAGTAAVFRCGLALPILVPLAVREWRRLGPRPWRHRMLDIGAGAFLGVDLVFWAESIGRIGAGLATVLLNVQVVIVPLLALVCFRERVSRWFVLTVPVLLAGVALAGGVIGPQPFGQDPVRGAVFGLVAGTAYAGYLVLLRAGGHQGYRVYPICLASVSCMVVATAVGAPWAGIDFAPPAGSVVWLVGLALAGPVGGWLLLAAALPRLASNVGATLLLLQPVLALLLGALLFAERPTGWQLAGCAVVVMMVWLTSRRGRS